MIDFETRDCAESNVAVSLGTLFPFALFCEQHTTHILAGAGSRSSLLAKCKKLHDEPELVLAHNFTEYRRLKKSIGRPVPSLWRFMDDSLQYHNVKNSHRSSTVIGSHRHVRDRRRCGVRDSVCSTYRFVSATIRFTMSSSRNKRTYVSASCSSDSGTGSPG